MHKIILFIFFLTLLNYKVLSQNFWEKINSPTSKSLNSLSFLDSLNGWVTGDSGLIIHTSNGGLDWETQYSNDSLNVVSVFFLNDELGWAAASSQFYAPYGTYIMKTTNGGITWTSEFLRIGEAYVNSLYFLDSLIGFAVGYPQVFHRTTDGGLTWTPVQLDSSIAASYPPYSIKFYSPQYGYACGGVRDIKGVVWRTTNGGLSWKTVVDTLTFETLFDLNIFDSLHVIVMGGDPEYGTSQVVTTDGGETWEYTALGVFYFPFSIGFRTDIEGWVPMGEQRKFLYTSNSGENWTEVTTPDSTDVLRICFPDSSHGFGIGRNGTIVKYIYRGPTNVVEEEEGIPDFYLLQNYPNPFNPTTNIIFRISELGLVTLKVYDVLGNEISTLVNEEKSEGSYTVTFDASGLPSGVYFYTLKVGNSKEQPFVTSKKMLILK